MTGWTETALGHAFRNKDLVDTALTHASHASGRASNERLEFLGDRVLNLALADLLYRRFAQESEGDLARRYAQLARQETLAAVARAIGLPARLKLSSAEEKSGGAQKDAILADALEALIAALFLDGGFDAARSFIVRAFEADIAQHKNAPSDPKSTLQEWAQGQGLPLPVYTLVDRRGADHAPEFVVQVQVRGCAPERAAGPSKQVAEKAAAIALLEKITQGAS